MRSFDCQLVRRRFSRCEMLEMRHTRMRVEAQTAAIANMSLPTFDEPPAPQRHSTVVAEACSHRVATISRVLLLTTRPFHPCTNDRSSRRCRKIQEAHLRVRSRLRRRRIATVPFGSVILYHQSNGLPFLCGRIEAAKNVMIGGDESTRTRWVTPSRPGGTSHLPSLSSVCVVCRGPLRHLAGALLVSVSVSCSSHTWPRQSTCSRTDGCNHTCKTCRSSNWTRLRAVVLALVAFSHLSLG